MLKVVRKIQTLTQCCHVCRRAGTPCAITASLLACTPRYDLWHQSGYWVSFDSSGLKSGRCKTVTVRSRWISIEDSPQASMACPSCEETITEDSISFLTWKQLVFVSYLKKIYNATLWYHSLNKNTLERSVRLNLDAKIWKRRRNVLKENMTNLVIKTQCQIWCTIELHRDPISKVLSEW